jgi:hypothetical protein
MNNPHNATGPCHQAENDRIEDYLDHLCTPLVGLVPYAVRHKLRMEAEAHLCALMAEFAEKGIAPTDALTAAMQEHGEPWGIGQAYADAWMRGSTGICPDRFVAPSVLHGLAWVGMASIPTLLLVEQGCLERYNTSMEWVGVIAVLAPFVAGVLTGFTAPARPVRAVCYALLLHILVSFAAGALLLPQTGGVRFACFQLIFWLPAACGSAWATAYFRLLQRRQRFLHHVCSVK